jgi:hypothetical protein
VSLLLTFSVGCDRFFSLETTDVSKKTGTNVFPTSEGPLYRKGMWISAAMCLMVAFLSGVLSCWLIWENRKMDREGVPEVEEFEQTSVQRESGRRERHRYVW